MNTNSSLIILYTFPLDGQSQVSIKREFAPR